MLISGCSWIKAQAVTDVKEVSYVDFGKILDQKRLNDGGRILFLPFSPGPNVFVDEEFDDISLRILRGVIDEFEENGQGFELVFNANDKNVDFTLDGRILKIQKISKIKKFLMFNKTVSLSVKGFLLDNKNGLKAAVFEHTLKSRGKKNLLDISQMLGNDIGKFLLMTK